MSAAQLKFVTSPLGLEPRTDFELVEVEGADALYKLLGGDTRLFVIDAAFHLPTYQPELARNHLEQIGAASIFDVTVLVVVVPGDGESTVNLAAPIIVNTATGACAQVILEGQDWPLRGRLI